MYKLAFLLIVLYLCGGAESTDWLFRDKRAFSNRYNCPPVSLPNGIARVISRGRNVRFRCHQGLRLVGPPMAECRRGRWSNPLPICVAPGCPDVTSSLSNGLDIESIRYNNALLTFACVNNNLLLFGNPSIYCNGNQWNGTVPTCLALPTSENTYSSCNFTTGMCGWVQDNTDHFNWTRSKHTTPTKNTGPSKDHTQDVQGYYAFIESSAPQIENDTARLISQTISHRWSDSCFDIWYHMFGGGQTVTVGWLNVYVKPADVSFDTLSPIFSKHGNQGDKWILGRIQIPTLSENFQIIIEAIRATGFYSDIAIDDLTLWDCPKSTTSTTISLTMTLPLSTALPHVTASPSTMPLISSSTLSSQMSSLPLTTRYPTGPPKESTTMGIESTVMTTQSTDFTTYNEIAGKITNGNKENNEATTKYMCESDKNCVKRGKTEASSEDSTQNVDLIPIIIGASLGGVAMVVLLGLIIWLFMRKRNNRGEVKPEEESMRPIISQHRRSLTNENKNCTQSTNNGKSNPVCITNNLYMAVP